MSGGELNVTATHLIDLADRQRAASNGITGAVVTTAGVEALVAASHGAIAESAYAALSALRVSRTAAGDDIAGRSAGFSERLTSAAQAYEGIDGQYGADLQRMQVS
jgi:hypothetical protein